MRRYLEALTDSALARDASYHSASRGRRMDPTWQVLVHVVNHGTDHRAQTLAMLHGLGAPTVAQDLMNWLWDRR